MPQTTDWADVQVVGIPRALLFYRFGVLWTTFFESIGRTVVVSEPTDKAIADGGDRLSVDECCLASKVFIGHVESLAGRCDAVFVPCYPDERPPQRVLHEVPVGHRYGAQHLPRRQAARHLLRGAKCSEGEGRAPRFCDMAPGMASRPRTPALLQCGLGRPARPRRGAGHRPGAHAAPSDRRAPGRRCRCGGRRRCGRAPAWHPRGGPPLHFPRSVPLRRGHRFARGDGRHGRLRRRHGSRARLQEELRVLRHHAVDHQPRAHRLHTPGPDSIDGIVLISAFPAAPTP